MGKKWIISLQDGEYPTFVMMHNAPVVMQVDEEELEQDWDWSPPIDCEGTEHIHIKDLLTFWQENHE